MDKIDDSAKIEVEAAALSPDGLRETVSRDWSARVPEALPGEAEPVEWRLSLVRGDRYTIYVDGRSARGGFPWAVSEAASLPGQ